MYDDIRRAIAALCRERTVRNTATWAIMVTTIDEHTDETTTEPLPVEDEVLWLKEN
jgi:hypothetical protein